MEEHSLLIPESEVSNVNMLNFGHTIIGAAKLQ
jgi:hypothetical protein